MMRPFALSLYLFLACVMARTVNGADTVTLPATGRPLLVYRQTPNPNKVYVSKLFSPAGVQVLLDSPADHVHHHGLMYGLDVDKVSFWTDGSEEGTQKPREPARTDECALEQLIDWVAPEGRVLLNASRRVLAQGSDASTLLTWRSQLRPAQGQVSVRLFTNKAYAGLGLRFPKSMDGKAVFLFPDGTHSTPIRNTEKVTSDRWCACTGPVAGEIVTVAMFSHPLTRRHPTHWFTMSDTLTYMTATLNLYRQPMILREGQRLNLVYGVSVWDGVVHKDVIETAYQRWLSLIAEPANQEGWESTHVNIARPKFGTTASASSVYGDGYGAERAIDGKWAVRETDKWNSKEHITPHYLRLDLGRPRVIDRIRIVHEGVLPDGDKATTSDFCLQKSTRPWGPWDDLTAPIRGNAEGISEHVFAPAEARYVRLLIETGEQNDHNAYGRIFEMEVYSPKETEK